MRRPPVDDQVRHPEEAGDGSADGPFEQRARFAVLRDAALEHQRDPVAWKTPSG